MTGNEIDKYLEDLNDKPYRIDDLVGSYVGSGIETKGARAMRSPVCLTDVEPQDHYTRRMSFAVPT
jgi:hypothetical protein